MNRQLNFGCGGNRLPHPWENYDVEVDISKPLPFPDACAAAVFAEHVVEHVSPADAWRFFKEVRRVLAENGVFRIAVPSIERVLRYGDNDYLRWLGQSGFGAPTKEAAVENLICNHGHQALWSVDLLYTCFEALGFREMTECRPGESAHFQLRGVEGHGKVIGERNNLIETIVVEVIR